MHAVCMHAVCMHAVCMHRKETKRDKRRDKRRQEEAETPKKRQKGTEGDSCYFRGHTAAAAACSQHLACMRDACMHACMQHVRLGCLRRLLSWDSEAAAGRGRHNIVVLRPMYSLQEAEVRRRQQQGKKRQHRDSNGYKETGDRDSSSY